MDHSSLGCCCIRNNITGRRGLNHSPFPPSLYPSDIPRSGVCLQARLQPGGGEGRGLVVSCLMAVGERGGMNIHLHGIQSDRDGCWGGGSIIHVGPSRHVQTAEEGAVLYYILE